MIHIRTSIYDEDTLALIRNDATVSLATSANINKVGNKFAPSSLTDILVYPFANFLCSHWYAAYFEHKTPVYPHTDNDSPGMYIIGIIPLIWDDILPPSTIVHNKTADTKIILQQKNTLPDLVTFTWTKNSALFFAHNMFHSSGPYTGTKTGIQLIGWR